MRRNDETVNSRIIVKYMRTLGWEMVRMGASKYGDNGIPDWYAMHKEHGTRWIEMKAYYGKLTPSQRAMFAKFAKNGVGVWVLLTRSDYVKLFNPPNWFKYA